jgi:hypothetical protein
METAMNEGTPQKDRAQKKEGLDEKPVPPETKENTTSPETPESERVWGEDLDLYPLKKPDEDPRWAVRTVWIWVGIALFFLAFILILLVLGLFYD